MQNASESLHVTFGDRLRRLRLSQGMDQKQFGDAIGVSGATVGKYELQLHDPRQARLVLNSIRLVYGKDAAAFVDAFGGHGRDSFGRGVKQTRGGGIKRELPGPARGAAWGGTRVRGGRRGS